MYNSFKESPLKRDPFFQEFAKIQKDVLEAIKDHKKMMDQNKIKPTFVTIKEEKAEDMTDDEKYVMEMAKKERKQKVNLWAKDPSNLNQVHKDTEEPATRVKRESEVSENETAVAPDTSRDEFATSSPSGPRDPHA
eukprot:g16654.t1